MAERTNAQIIIATVIAIIVGLLIALAGSDGGDRVGALPVFALCGVLAFAVNWLAFVPAVLTQTEHYYDLTGGITYITVTVTAVLLSSELDLRATLVAAMSWSGRYGSHRSCFCGFQKAAATIASTTSRTGRRASSWPGHYRACGYCSPPQRRWQ